MSPHITVLPCGCVAAIESIICTEPTDVPAVECPWCGDSFSMEELKQWWRSLTEVPFVTYALQPRTLVAHGDRLLEAMGWCEGCGIPQAREFGSQRVFHLRVPLAELTVLEN